MTAKLDGTALMDIDVSRFNGQHTLITVQHGVDDGGIGLRTAHKEKDVSIRAVAGCADLLLGRCAVIIQAVSCGLFIVGLCEPTQYRLVATIVIITLE